MNKTVTINLGGFFFHIDEDAYQKLNRYFDAIKQSLTGNGREEIMSDIESRVAELLGEKINNDRQVVSSREVDDIIAVMGQPEDYRIDDDAPYDNAFAPNYTKRNYNTYVRKFYLDTDRAMVGGVCAGLGHYFRIDPLWIRVLFVISLFLSFGTSLFVYLLLLVLIPKAITTSEKLEMTGEPITISNIEKKVREEFDTLSDKIKNVDYNRLGMQAKTGARHAGESISHIFSAIFRVIGKIIGTFIVIVSALILGGLVIGFISLLFSLNYGPIQHIGVFNYTDVPLWVLGLLGFITIGIPFFFLFMLGLKILVDNLKPISSITRYTLLALWILALCATIFLGIKQKAQTAFEGKTVKKEQLALNPKDTLQVKFRYNDYFAKSVDYSHDYRITQDANKNTIIYSNNISFHILKTDDKVAYLQIERLAESYSPADAAERAEKIKYNFELKGNTLLLDNYLITDVANKHREQKVAIYLYLPEGTLFKPDTSVQVYDNSDKGFFDLIYDADNSIYRVGKSDVQCLNCIDSIAVGRGMTEEEAKQLYLLQKKEEAAFMEEQKQLDIEARKMDAEIRKMDAELAKEQNQTN